ncbi:Protein of unknown function, partial [Gryllus bimaculatus]
MKEEQKEEKEEEEKKKEESADQLGVATLIGDLAAKHPDVTPFTVIVILSSLLGVAGGPQWRLFDLGTPVPGTGWTGLITSLLEVPSPVTGALWRDFT